MLRVIKVSYTISQVLLNFEVSLEGIFQKLGNTYSIKITFMIS